MMRPDAKILVLGHRGLIGSALMRRLQHRGFDKVTGASRAEADLEQAPDVIRLMAETTPDYVFLCAGKVGGITQNQITPADFIRTGNAVALKPDGRKAFFRAYEQRMDTLVTHPIFGYRLNYRRLLEIQTRLLARVVTGQIPTYPVFVTR